MRKQMNYDNLFPFVNFVIFLELPFALLTVNLSLTNLSQPYKKKLPMHAEEPPYGYIQRMLYDCAAALSGHLRLNEEGKNRLLQSIRQVLKTCMPGGPSPTEAFQSLYDFIKRRQFDRPLYRPFCFILTTCIHRRQEMSEKMPTVHYEIVDEIKRYVDKEGIVDDVIGYRTMLTHLRMMNRDCTESCPYCCKRVNSFFCQEQCLKCCPIGKPFNSLRQKLFIAFQSYSFDGLTSLSEIDKVWEPQIDKHQ